ncbi:unnamed protein product [Lota lota]
MSLLFCIRQRRQVLVLVLLVSHALCDDHSVSESCCSREPSRACRLYVLLLCGPGGSAGQALSGKSLGEDASAGILTLGKREAEEQQYHSLLHQLLRSGARNRAAGILTMGKRSEEDETVGLLIHNMNKTSGRLHNMTEMERGGFKNCLLGLLL